MKPVRKQHPELPLDPDVEAGRSRPFHIRPVFLALVALGGVAGTAARYGVSLAEPSTNGHWPMGTFIVNLAGAFILGALLEGLARRGRDEGWRQGARLLFGSGFCGAFTTYSTLAVETDLLVRDHATGLAVAYATASPIAGLVVTGAGIAVATGHRQWRMAKSAP